MLLAEAKRCNCEKCALGHVLPTPHRVKVYSITACVISTSHFLTAQAVLLVTGLKTASLSVKVHTL